jgi:hypothetical protein
MGRRATLAAVCLLLALPRCACEDELNTLVPDILITPESLDMGRRTVGIASDALFRVGNEGTAAVNILEYRVDALSAADAAELFGGDFLSLDGSAFEITAGPEQVFAQRSEDATVTFLPMEQGRYAGRLVVRSDDLDKPEVSIAILGEGGPPLIEADPNPVDFGEVNEGPGASAARRASPSTSVPTRPPLAPSRSRNSSASRCR